MDGLSQDYLVCVEDLLASGELEAMARFHHHGRTDCYQHSLYVSYTAWRMAVKWRLSPEEAARAGLLHDFYLYDWHDPHSHRRPHGFRHPAVALKNAVARFHLTPHEQNAILRHMWPLTLVPPGCAVAWLLTLADKYCALVESIGLNRRFLTACWAAKLIEEPPGR